MDAIVGLPARTWETARGSIATWAPARGMFVTRVIGHVDAEIAGRMISGGNDVVARDGKLIGFHDWSGVTSYDSACRQQLTQWGFDIRNDVERVHFLVTNKLVRMGVSVASIVLLGMLVAHDDAVTFETQLASEIEKRKIAPRPRRSSGFGSNKL